MTNQPTNANADPDADLELYRGGVRMDGVRDLASGNPIHLTDVPFYVGGDRENRVCAECAVVDGWGTTELDVVDLLVWLRNNRPDVLALAGLAAIEAGATTS